MFISKLIHIVEKYDQYGLHRLNGVKVVYILFILFGVNIFITIPSVYFYFFYIPITAMTAEVMFDQIDDKYLGFIYTMLGTSLMVFIFNILKPYPLFFILAVFFGTITLYVTTLRWNALMLPFVPVILSLASYSLIYPTLNMNDNMVINNGITTLFALAIILTALILFPLSYYYRLWLRAFILLLEEVRENCRLIAQQQVVQFSLVQGHTRYLVSFSSKLPRKFPIFSILKINLLINQFHMASCVGQSELVNMKPADLQKLIEDVTLFIDAIKKEKTFYLDNKQYLVLYQLVNTWNKLCSRL